MSRHYLTGLQDGWLTYAKLSQIGAVVEMLWMPDNATGFTSKEAAKHVLASLPHSQRKELEVTSL